MSETTAQKSTDDSTAPSSILTTREISFDEAREVAGRLINSHFRQEPHARASIPARPDYDDDLLIMAFIAQQEAAAEARVAQDAEVMARAVNTVNLDEDEPRFASEHVLDNLGVPDDAGPHAIKRILRDNRTIGQQRTTIKAMTDALRHARPLIEKYGWTQGDSASFHRSLVGPIDAALALEKEPS